MKLTNLVEFYEGDTSTEMATGMLNQILAKVAGKSKKDSNMKTEESTDFSDYFSNKA